MIYIIIRKCSKVRKKKLLIKNLRITRRTMYCALAFVLISITTMTLAYAALNTTLTITGTAEFKEASFGISIEEIDAAVYWEWGGTTNGNIVTYGDAQLITKPTITGTSINNYRISLRKPGDQIYLIYKVTNVGNIPVMLESISYNDPIFTSSTNNTDDIKLMQDNFSYEYDLYELIQDGDYWYEGYYFNTGYILCPGKSLAFELWNGYNYTATQIPSNNITISNLSAQFNFTAADINVCKNGQNPNQNQNQNQNDPI